MIKWGRRRKKQQQPSSPRPSLLSSWLLRLKKMGGGSDGGGAGKDNKPAAPVVKAAAVAPCSRSRISNRHNSSSSTTAQREEFYGGDEAFWSLSFRKEKIYSGYETEEEEDEEEEGEVMSNFSEMVSGIRRMKELQRIKTTTTTTPRRRIRSDYEFCPGDQRRKSVYVNRGSPAKRRNRVRVVVSSPRVGAARGDDVVNCRSSRNRVKKKKEKGGLERFAVVKCSSDPERDFRESMVEMILEMKICGGQQLEDLLACYLALNADEYHHLIITVFRQIWFHLNYYHSQLN